MGTFFITKLIRFVGMKLDGYKTTVGGIGMILTGLMGIIGIMFPDVEVLPKNMSLDESIILISGGFGVIGIGGKMEKTKRALETENKA